MNPAFGSTPLQPAVSPGVITIPIDEFVRNRDGVSLSLIAAKVPWLEFTHHPRLYLFVTLP
jgi:hypothetical protein